MSYYSYRDIEELFKSACITAHNYHSSREILLEKDGFKRILNRDIIEDNLDRRHIEYIIHSFLREVEAAKYENMVKYTPPIGWKDHPAPKDTISTINTGTSITSGSSPLPPATGVAYVDTQASEKVVSVQKKPNKKLLLLPRKGI